MSTTGNVDIHELLQIIDNVAREKSISREIITKAMEDAIEKSARSSYGSDYDIRVCIDHVSKTITILRYLEVVQDDAEFEGARQVLFSEARKIKDDVEIGEYLIENLPPVEIGRVSAQASRQIIIQRIREAEKQREYDEFEGAIGQIVHGVVRRIEFGNVIVDINGTGEGIIRREQQIPRENFRIGDRVRAYCYKVKRDNFGIQVFLSRSHNQFLSTLFCAEVPEIYEGLIEIKAVARDPGSRAKIVVKTNDRSLDPLGACIGMRGVRVQAVTEELRGERIDVIEWSDDVSVLMRSLFAPVAVLQVVVNEGARRIDIVVSDDSFSRAVGRRGQNVRLVSQIIGWNVDILTETEGATRRQEEFVKCTAFLVEALEIEELMAQLLVAEGFLDVEDILQTPLEEVASIDGLDIEIAEALQERALLWKEEAPVRELRALEYEAELADIDGMTAPMLLSCIHAGIKSIEDFAGCAVDELLTSLVDMSEIQQDDGLSLPEEKVEYSVSLPLDGFDLSSEQVSSMVMQAREKAGWL